MLQFFLGSSRDGAQKLLSEIGLQLKALIIPGDKTHEGQLVTAVALPWFEIVKLMEADPDVMHKIDWRRWEEIIAGAYERAGFDEVILTPSSGDKGRDVVATKHGVGSIRIFDQVKAYAPNRPVTADDVRAMLGVIHGANNVSKGVLTTTSTFAPGVFDDEYIKPFLPYRLELKSGTQLIDWLGSLSANEE
jgi:restriction system protein